jgi:subfamily B ATP-binding cassette protein MsbA
MLKESISIYKRLFPFVSCYWRTFVVAILCTIPLSLCSAGIAYLVKPALDDIFLKKDLQMLKIIPIGIIILYAVRGFFDYTYDYLLGSVGNRIMTDFRNRVYAHLQTLSLSFFLKSPTGVIMSRITNDVNILQGALNSGIIDLIKDTLTILGLLAVLIKQDFKLACISFIILPWILIPLLKLGKKSRNFSTRGQQKVGKISTFIHETITGSRIVKAFGMEQYENDRFSKENVRLLRIRLKRLKIRSISGPIMELIGGIAGAAVILYGGYNVLNGTSTPGTFFSFVAALLLTYGPAKNISTSYQDIQEGLAAAKRVFHILDTEPDVKESENAVPLPVVKGDISFSNVFFAYDKEPVLHNINLEIKAGEIIAIVGMTGSGKTTLVNLIQRFFDPTSGIVRIDGWDVKEVKLKSLRQQVSFVSQHPFLFNDTVRNNIAFGDPTQSEDKIIAAAKSAYAHEFIKDMPAGYDTVIGQHGEKISGGQRQRISIARAILKDAPILILDEATSSLDSQMEVEVQHSLETLMMNKTTLIISHRLSTIRNATRIIVLSNGKIVEEGSHDELFSLGGEYTKLYSVYLHDDKTADVREA